MWLSSSTQEPFEEFDQVYVWVLIVADAAVWTESCYLTAGVSSATRKVRREDRTLPPPSLPALGGDHDGGEEVWSTYILNHIPPGWSLLITQLSHSHLWAVGFPPHQSVILTAFWMSMVEVVEFDPKAAKREPNSCTVRILFHGGIQGLRGENRHAWEQTARPAVKGPESPQRGKALHPGESMCGNSCNITLSLQHADSFTPSQSMKYPLNKANHSYFSQYFAKQIWCQPCCTRP